LTKARDVTLRPLGDNEDVLKGGGEKLVEGHSGDITKRGRFRRLGETCERDTGKDYPGKR
jgi:hypothetical protein